MKNKVIKVTVRKQKMKDGIKSSLFLDFYPPQKNEKTGKLTRRDFLGIYVYNNPKTIIEKNHNEEQKKLAELMRQDKEREINRPVIYSAQEKEQLKFIEKSKENFVKYFRKLADERKSSNHDNWISALHYLEDFTKGHISFAELDIKFCEDFKKYLLSVKSKKSDKAMLSNNSALSYYSKFRVALKQGYRDNYLKDNLYEKTTPIKEEETQREFLTMDELRRLAKIPCENKLLRNAALFSALTGLRFSDIMNLTWSEIQYSKETGHSLHFRQVKTKGAEVLPISEEAYSLLGERKEPTDRVFDGLTYSAYQNKHLYQWLGAAGITRKITFHCFRHTFATLQLSYGTDIYTVSKMLGHRSLVTTQIYAKVMDKQKQEAANRIRLEF